MADVGTLDTVLVQATVVAVVCVCVRVRVCACVCVCACACARTCTRSKSRQSLDSQGLCLPLPGALPSSLALGSMHFQGVRAVAFPKAAKRGRARGAGQGHEHSPFPGTHQPGDGPGAAQEARALAQGCLSGGVQRGPVLGRGPYLGGGGPRDHLLAPRVSLLPTMPCQLTDLRCHPQFNTWETDA